MVKAVATFYTPAMFVYGVGGLGKSHHIRSELDAICGDKWKHWTAGMTPRALFDVLAADPHVVHLFEDCEEMYVAALASSILRAACGSPNGKPRTVTYNVKGFDGRVTFTGGIIIVSNKDISQKRGELAAVASRFCPVEWALTMPQRMAIILDMADAGWDRGEVQLTPDECRTVAEFLATEWEKDPNGIRFDIRTYAEHCLPGLAFAKAFPDGTPWQEIIMAKIRRTVTEDEGQAMRTDRLQDVAVFIANRSDLDTTVKRLAEWKAQTGLGQVIYYRHLKNARKAGKGK